MRSTDALRPGAEAIDLGTPITVPVGITPTLGCISNVISEPVDEQVHMMKLYKLFVMLQHLMS
jgi:F0F1-type ATP synthase beta subunit